MADVTLHLVDPSSLDSLMQMSIDEISLGMENCQLRGIRPEQDPRFHRDFDIDLEGDILELIDGDITLHGKSKIIDIHSESAIDLTILLAKWCSSAQWSCWEARLFLYVEPNLGRAVSGSEEFLDPKTWEDFAEELSKTDKSSFSESVVIDWMSRREEMGETLEPSEDPRILPTMESHRSLSESLYSIIDQSRRSDSKLLIGREYLEGGSWSLGSKNLSEICGVYL